MLSTKIARRWAFVSWYPHKKRLRIVVGVIYRHPDESVPGMDKFYKDINDLFLTMNNNKGSLRYIVFGDFDINLLKLLDKAVIRWYTSMLMSCNYWCLINKPSRIGPSSSTLIDHIYSNDKFEPAAAGVLTNANLNDHYGIFTIIPQGLLKKKQILGNFEVRDISKFNLEEFCNHLNFKLAPLSSIGRK